ncbi:MAG: serine/threonine protein kinase [Planctomycetes bacterium]|nr:serine/threonine protein kinase [Planctomycetota bacterium]
MNAFEDNARSIFLAALERAPDQWPAFLDEACGDNAELRARVDQLLHSHQAIGSIHAIGNIHGGGAEKQDGTRDQSMAERPGAVIGPYKLLQQIGEGGFGTVFMAEQTQPVQRKVALKVIKPGMGGRQVIARFEAERQALAMMDHVNIARVLDAGTTESGLPYFVMELVHGVPITKYCDDNQLTPRERLELFVPVCQAIQHAHQKGIIHRDIKPSNVMVTLYDGKPVPKVIDFGVAKATEQKLTERTLFTQYGTMVGTLEYMSPEQAEMSGLGADTRSDIYSLGVLLYELLTGSTPLSHKRLKEAAYAEILRMIKEEEPPKPSTRLSDSGEALASISAHRHMEPAKLTKLVKGELDWIVMKCLEKDRNRRYETANGFAADVQRYLDDEPVLACPPSAVYRLGKFVRRNRGQVIVVAVVLLCLIGGMVGTTWGLIRAINAEEQAKDDAKKAKRSDEEARAVLGFFQERVLSALRPKGLEGGLGKDATIRDALDAAEPEIEKAFAGQPLAEATIRDTLATSYWHLGENEVAIRQYERALALRRQALGPNHRDTLMSMNNLANAYGDAGRIADSLALHEQTLRERRAQLGPEDIDTLESLNNLGMFYIDAGRPAEAVPLLEESFRKAKAKLGPDHVDSLSGMGNLVRGYVEAGRPTEALPLALEVVERCTLKLGLDHPGTLIARQNLALTYRDMGRLSEALPLFEDVRNRAEAVVGGDHPGALSGMYFLGVAYQCMGRLDDAGPLLAETLKRCRAKIGSDHRKTLMVIAALAATYEEAGELGKAEPLGQELVSGTRRRLGLDHPDTNAALTQLSLILVKQHKLDDAEPLAR